MFQPVLDPLGASLAWSSLAAVVPLAVFFVLLGVVRLSAVLSALASLASAMAVAVWAYGMPPGQTVDAAALGAAFGLFPIMWIVVNALWVYQMTVDTGHFAVLRRSFSRLSDDRRVQAIVVAFCFGALLEALAGFGAPVAISSVMLIALGFRPFQAATVALVANTAPVAYGAMGTPVTTLAQLTGLPLTEVAATVGRQTPVLSVVVPLLLVFLVDGRRGLRQTWVPALACGLAFGLAQFACSNYLSVPLTDVLAALVSVAVLIAVTRIRGGGASPAEGGAEDTEVRKGPEAREEAPEAPAAEAARTGGPATREDRSTVVKAYLPYAVIIVVFAVTQIPAVASLLEAGSASFAWPGLHVADPVSGQPSSSTRFVLDWLPATGTMLLLSGVVVALALPVAPGVALRAYGRTLHQLRWAILTVALVLALAYVMNLSGQTATVGHAIAGAGGALAFLSPVLGWLGVAVTGSDTSSNALFGTLQVTAARSSGFRPELLAAANSSGGVLSKMLSPQNLAIAAAAAGLGGREAELLRKVVGWSLVLLLGMCLLVFLQSTPVLGWMLPS